MPRRNPSRQPKPPRDMRDASANELIQPKWLTPYHFGEEPVVVQIERVMAEEVFNRQTGKFDTLNIFYFYNIDKGLKVPPSHVKRIQKVYGDKVGNWYDKFIRLIHVEEESFGEKYYLTRIDPEPVDQNRYQNNQSQPAQNDEIPKAASLDQLQQIEAFGSQLYGGEWQKKCSELAYAISERTNEIEKLYESEANRMIRGIISKINEQPSDMPQNTDPEPEPQPDPQPAQPPPQQAPEGREIQF